MWISNKNNWHESHTDLSKYLVEKVKQQVDNDEIISNRHRTTNGYVLIQELVLMIGLVKRKIKFKRRLESLLEEAKSNILVSSVVNDYVLQKHFPDIVDFIKSLTKENLENGKIERLHQKLLIISNRLEKHYLSSIEQELKSIDFKSDKFVKYSNKIDKLIDCLVPYLLFVGYSITSISDITYSSITKGRGETSFIRLLKRFRGEGREFKFLFITKKNSPEFNFIRNKLNNSLIKKEVVTYDQIKDHLKNEDLRLEDDTELVELTLVATDPHDFLRAIYDSGIKLYVASKDRLTLNYFTDFFDNVYWRISKTKHLYSKSKISIDPVNITARVSTLRDTLDKLSNDYDLKFKYEDDLPLIREIHEAVYFYNLALGSKSIENSLSLLWTSLETLIPYRSSEYDIENVRHFVCKSLALGSISRQLVSFVQRFVFTSNLNQNKLGELGMLAKYVKFTPHGLCTWANWLCNEYTSDKDDPYNKIREYSNLLCKQFCTLNDMFTGKNGDTVETLLNKIKSSESSISYQLDRIYLHRNKIVHAGEFINEYSNLWSHLEWYVGKLISYSVLNAVHFDNHNQSDIFLKLESDYEHIINLLEKRKNEKIKDAKDIFPIIFEHTWQSF